VGDPDSNAEIAVDSLVYLMHLSFHFVGYLNEERVLDVVNGFVGVIVVVVDEQPDLYEFEIVAEQDVICDSAVIGPSDFDLVDLDDLNVVGAVLGHLANAD
jgi:hypothetical protein